MKGNNRNFIALITYKLKSKEVLKQKAINITCSSSIPKVAEPNLVGSSPFSARSYIYIMHDKLHNALSNTVSGNLIIYQIAIWEKLIVGSTKSFIDINNLDTCRTKAEDDKDKAAPMTTASSMLLMLTWEK